MAICVAFRKQGISNAPPVPSAAAGVAEFWFAASAREFRFPGVVLSNKSSPTRRGAAMSRTAAISNGARCG
ncbi:hypothetical protein E2562_035200 [Oryza meyeriana var. granulata]|uniref:Uncharacterized protein n=1 Tax=Oryza meyeriana var. granulata TaxID=110450 RepID=A0A6G1DA94_9ORYZ|nr:hypothetical protein E2562_035200 [Oryza meyeriana var. granulata]